MTPFIYKLTHVPTGRLYIGSRFGQGVSPDSFWTTYFTSSKVVAAMIEEDGKECWTWEIFERPGRAAEEVFREEHDMIADAISRRGRAAVINRFVHSNGKPFFLTGEHSLATKEKMRAAAKKVWASTEDRSARGKKGAETRRAKGLPSPLLGRPSPIKGVPKSENARAAMSRARKGKVLPHMLGPKDATLYKVVNIDDNTSFTATQYELRSLTGLDAQEINNLIKGRVKRSKRWRLAAPLPSSQPPAQPSTVAPQ